MYLDGKAICLLWEAEKCSNPGIHFRPTNYGSTTIYFVDGRKEEMAKINIDLYEYLGDLDRLRNKLRTIITFQ